MRCPNHPEILNIRSVYIGVYNIIRHMRFVFVLHLMANLFIATCRDPAECWQIDSKQNRNRNSNSIIHYQRNNTYDVLVI